MLKVTVDGEVYAYDETSQPLDEAIEIEDGLDMSYGAYEAGLQNGSAKAMAAFIWSVLKRNGRSVPLDDIVTGKYPVNSKTILLETEGGENPTGDGDGPLSSPPTGGGTSGSSRKSSVTRQGKSAS